MIARLAAAVLVVGLGISGNAAAQDAGVPEIVTLEAQLTHDVAELGTGDCAVACRALASMERTAQHICALDTGARCAAARDKVRDATRRVREACGPCRGQETDAPPLISAEPKSPGAKGEAQPPSPSPSPVQLNAPPRGGCAGCVIGGEDQPLSGLAVFASLGALAALVRRRRR